MKNLENKWWNNKSLTTSVRILNAQISLKRSGLELETNDIILTIWCLPPIEVELFSLVLFANRLLNKELLKPAYFITEGAHLKASYYHK